MGKIPKFMLYWENDQQIETQLKQFNGFINWDELKEKDKQNIFLYLEKNNWISPTSLALVIIWDELNISYMKLQPFRTLNLTPLIKDSKYHFITNHSAREQLAYNDFETIILSGGQNIVYKVISKFAEFQIDTRLYNALSESSIPKEVNDIFSNLDKFCNCFNHISEQYGLNMILSREWFIPRQEVKIINDIYIPTIALLSNIKWVGVDKELRKVFEAFNQKNFASCISHSHNTIQKFLQVFLWKDESNWTWAFGALFSEFKKNKDLCNKFTEHLIDGTQKYLSSERARKSDSKPIIVEPNIQDALLVMNSAIVFINYCLTKTA